MPSLGQVVTPVPASIQDIAGQFALTSTLSFEQQIQSGTQGNTTNGNPFAYRHGVQIRPWFHYDGIHNLTITGSVSYIDYFNVPGTSNFGHAEWRVTALVTLKQRLRGASLYEQVRLEELNFRDSHGVRQYLPRVRARLGQNIYLGSSPSKPYLGAYVEAIVQFPRPSYSRVKFQDARFFAGYGFQWGARAHVLLGFKAEGEVSSSASSVTLYFGPVFSLSYTFTRRPLNEKHNRTTAFNEF